MPSTWEVNGYDYPIFVNIGYEFPDRKKASPPLVPLDYNPTGVKHREIKIGMDWTGKQVILHIGAAKSTVRKNRYTSKNHWQQNLHSWL